VIFSKFKNLRSWEAIKLESYEAGKLEGWKAIKLGSYEAGMLEGSKAN
jgi:hypothetical protein